MEKLLQLVSLCACAVDLDVNRHRNYYETVQEYLDGLEFNEKEEIPLDVRKKMVETDTVVDLTFYMHSATGFYTVRHYDIESALNDALEIVKERLTPSSATN